MNNTMQYNALYKYKNNWGGILEAGTNEWHLNGETKILAN